MPSCSRSGPLNLAPWLYVLPGDLSPFQELLRRLGVPEAFGAEFAHALKRMAEQANGEALPPAQLDQAVSIIQVLMFSLFS